MARIRGAQILLTAGLFLLATLAFSGPALGAAPTAENPIILKFSMFNSPRHLIANEKTGSVTWWARQVEERTGGRVKIKFYYSQALGKAKDHFDIARNGIADITAFVQAYTPGNFPLSSIVGLPFAAPNKSSEVLAKALWRLYQEGHLDETYKQVKVLALEPTDRYQLFLNKKATSADGLKGVKIRSMGMWAQILKKWGANPVPMPTTEVYMSLQRGIIQGLAHNWASAPAYKTYEVIKYVAETNMSCVSMGMAMNLEKWNSLPADIQQIIEKLNEESVGFTTYGSKENGILGYELYGKEVSRPLYIEKGIEVYAIPAPDMKKMMEAVVPLWDSWIAGLEKKGLPAKKTMKAYINILKDLGAEPIFKPTW